MWLVDLDELAELDRRLWAFGHDRRALTTIRARDHLGDPSRSIKANLLAYLAEHGVDLEGGRVSLLTNARVLGYVFNPLSVYYCHAAGGELRCVVAEVHNTYGERHCYLLRARRARPGRGRQGVLRLAVSDRGRPLPHVGARAGRAAVGADGAAPGRPARLLGLADRPAAAADRRARCRGCWCATR